MTGAGFRCLAIDTASDLPNVAACDGEARSSRSMAGDDGRTERIFGVVDEVLAELELELGDLDCVAVGRGPGSFTGLRVGMAAAQALAFGAGLPVCPVSSLAALAFGAARQSDSEYVVAALDARMGEVYAGAYRIDGNVITETDADIVAAPAALSLSGTHRFLAAGPGWGTCPELGERFAHRLLGVDAKARPQALDILVLAEAAFGRGESMAPTDALPVYLRDRVTG